MGEMSGRWKSHSILKIEVEMTLLIQRIMGDGCFEIQLDSKLEFAKSVNTTAFNSLQSDGPPPTNGGRRCSPASISQNHVNNQYVVPV